MNKCCIFIIFIDKYSIFEENNKIQTMNYRIHQQNTTIQETNKRISKDMQRIGLELQNNVRNFIFKLIILGLFIGCFLISERKNQFFRRKSQKNCIVYI